MKNMKWSKLSSLELGHYAEQDAKAQMMIYGLKVYSTDVDDHGVDFIVKNAQGIYAEIQVKAARFDQKNKPYLFMSKDTFKASLYVMVVLFEDGKLPDTYLISATEWLKDCPVFSNYEYEGEDKKSKPEYGIRLSNAGLNVLSTQYRIEDQIPKIINKSNYTPNVNLQAFEHLNVPDKNGKIYCRRKNGIVEFNADECFKCQLLSGCGQGMGVECFYPDLDVSDDTPDTPQRRYHRINDLIRMGLIEPEAQRIGLESVVDEAIAFAMKAHRGMVRKGTSTPYILHPLEAAAIVSTMTENENVIAAAVLHDVLENTDVTFGQLEQKFGYIAELVAEESENKRENQPPEETWKIRKQETIEHFKNKATKEAKMIALGDKLSNIRAIYKDYQTLGDSLWERFNQKDKSEHGWYYKAMRDVLSELKDYPAWQEYSKLVDLVFGTNEI